MWREDGARASVLRVLTGVTGSIIAIESLALVVGLFLVARGSPWAGAKNGALALTDIAGGAWLIYLAVKPGDGTATVQFYLLIALLAATHMYREWEFLAGVEHAFCGNVPLFVFNNIKLLGLVSAAAMGLLL